jgi:hypothetical protein
MQVTLQSFTWSSGLAGAGAAEQLRALAEVLVGAMEETPAVGLEAAFAVRPADVAAVLSKPTSGLASGLAASVRSVLIGKVGWARGAAPRGGARQGRAGRGPQPLGRWRGGVRALP